MRRSDSDHRLIRATLRRRRRRREGRKEEEEVGTVSRRKSRRRIEQDSAGPLQRIIEGED